MSVIWTYIPNEKQEQGFCPHCAQYHHGAYFSSEEDPKRGPRNDVVCLRCAKVLSRAYKIAMERSE